jgi:hypothetical protein
MVTENREIFLEALMLGLIIESIIGKKSDEILQEKIEEGGIPQAVAWLLAGVGATAIVSIGKKIIETKPKSIDVNRRVRVRWPYAFSDNVEVVSSGEDKGKIWKEFSDYEEYQKFLEAASPDELAPLICFWQSLPEGLQGIVRNI